MASEVGSAFVTIVPSFRGFGAALNKQVTAAGQGVGKGVGQQVGADVSEGFSNPLDDLKSKFLGALSVGAIVGGLSSAINSAKDFDLVIRQVGQSAGVGGKGLKGLSDLAIQMGQDTVFSAADAANAMLELAKGGMRPAEIRGGALASTLTLASAGGLELSDSATAVSNGLHTFGLRAKDANSVAAALAGAANGSSDSVAGLTLGLSAAGSQAHQSGLSIQETTAALAIFANNGVKGSDAGTSLKTMLQRLVPSTKDAANTMKDLGLKFTDSHGKFDDLATISQKLHDKLGPLSAEQKTLALNTIFGADASRAAAFLMDSGRSGVEKMTKVTSDLTQAQKMAKTGTEGASGAWENFTGSLDTLRIELGQTLLPAFTAVTDYVTQHVIPIGTDAVKAFGRVLGAIQRGASGDISTDKGPLGFIARIAHDATALPGKLAGIGAKIAAPFRGIGKKISDGLGKFDISTITDDLGKNAGKAAGDVVNSLVAAFASVDYGKVGTTLGKGIASAASKVAMAGAQITAAIGALMQTIKWGDIARDFGREAPTLILGLITGLLNFDIGSLFQFVTAHWVEVLLGVLTIAFMPAKVLGPIGALLERIPLVGTLLAWLLRASAGMARGAVSMVGRVVGALGMAFLEGFARVFPTIGGFLVRELPLISTRVGVFFVDLGPRISGWVKTAFGFIGKGIETAASAAARGIGSLFGSLLSAIGRGFSRAFGPITSGVGRMISGLVSGIAGGVGSVVGAAARLFASLLARVGSGLGSVVARAASGAASIVGRLAGAIGSGVARVVGAVGRLVGSLLSRLASGLAGVATRAASAAGEIVTRIISTLATAAGKVAAPIRAMGTRLISTVKGFVSQAVTAGEQIVSGIGQGIRNAVGAAVTAAREAAGKVLGAIKNAIKPGSPSKVTTAYGVTISTGLAKGMNDAAPVAILAANLLGYSVVGALKGSTSGDAIAGIANAVGSTFADALKGSSGEILSAGQSMSESVFAAFDAVAADQEKYRQAISDANDEIDGLLDQRNQRVADRTARLHEIETTYQTARKKEIADFANDRRNMQKRIDNAETSLATAKNAAQRARARRELADAKADLAAREKVNKAALGKGKGSLLAKEKADRAKALSDASKDLAKIDAQLKTSRDAIAASNDALAALNSLPDALLSSSARDALVTSLQAQSASLAALADQRDEIAQQLSDAQDKLTEAIRVRSDFAQGIKDQAQSFGALLNIKLDDGAVLNTDTIKKSLADRLDTLRAFAANIKALRARGLSDTYLQELVSAGAESGGAMAQALVSGPDSAIGEINNFASEFEGIGADLGGQAAGWFYDAGVESAKGLVKGLQDQKAGIEEQMVAIAMGMQTAIKAALGIKSPSRVFHGVGGYVVEGLANGLTDGRKTLGRARDALYGVLDRLPGVPGVNAGGIAPLAAASSAATINVYPRPGQSERDIASAVSREFAWRLP